MRSSVEKAFDRATVRGIVEEHWRKILPIRGYGMRAKNTALVEQMGNQLKNRIEAWANSLPPDQSKELIHMFVEETNLAIAEWKRDPVGFARRLGILSGRVSHRQGIGEMAVRTAVRAWWPAEPRFFAGPASC
jgi:hypothetical protein